MQKNITTDPALRNILVYFEGAPEYDFLNMVEKYIHERRNEKERKHGPGYLASILWDYKYYFFGAGVVWGKRMERARRKAARTNNNGRGCENP